MHACNVRGQPAHQRRRKERLQGIGHRDSMNAPQPGGDRMRNQLAVVAMLTVTCWVATSQAQAPAADKPAAAPAGAAPAGGAQAAAGERRHQEVGRHLALHGHGQGSRRPGDEVHSTWTIKPTLGGHWYALTYKRSKIGPDAGVRGQRHRRLQHRREEVLDDRLRQLRRLDQPQQHRRRRLQRPERRAWARSAPAKFSFAPGKDKKGEDSDKLFDVTMDFGARQLDRELQEVAGHARSPVGRSLDQEAAHPDRAAGDGLDAPVAELGRDVGSCRGRRDRSPASPRACRRR